MKRKEFINQLEHFGIEPQYALGQNFIWDRDFLQELLAEAGAFPLDCVLEIGAGAGTLTEVLASQARRVLSIEIDRRTEGLLRSLEAKYDSLEILFCDAKTADLRGLFSEEERKNLKIVANLPYYLTSDLIRHCLLSLPEAEQMFFMVQKDIVPRLRGTAGDGKSKVKNQGSLMKLISCYGELRTHKTVSAAHFYPAPRVDSQFISLLRKEIPGVTEVLLEAPEELAAVIDQAYSQRRKTLVNCFPEKSTKEKIVSWLKFHNLAENIRAEQLTAAEFASLTRELCL